MPYITKEKRQQIDWGTRPRTSGELNYRLTKTVREYMADKGISYATINDIVGALEACKLEFYRRVVTPYEQSKLEVNGDVYES